MFHNFTFQNSFVKTVLVRHNNLYLNNYILNVCRSKGNTVVQTVTEMTCVVALSSE